MSGEMIVAYLAAGVLFIRSLGGLSKQETAQDGNGYGVLGMTLAIMVTGVSWMSRDGIVVRDAAGHFTVRGVVLRGRPLRRDGRGDGAGRDARPARRDDRDARARRGAAQLRRARGGARRRVVVPLAGGRAQRAPPSDGAPARGVRRRRGRRDHPHRLGGRVGQAARHPRPASPCCCPGGTLLNAVAALAIAGLAVPFMQAPGSEGLPYLLAIVGLAALLGTHLVMAIGGADMPVVVSLLNSYSGWAAAAAGFMLANDLLIVTGALVGSSGTILSIIMCRAMNRSILSVVFGGFGTSDKAGRGARGDVGEVHEMKADEVAQKLVAARTVVVVPGYGMAVSSAQGAVKELTTALRERGVEVRFAIHPVAGRLPGHMNVLLAEAGVPYDIVHEMEHINVELRRAPTSCW
jgi:NAD(P) transhydrogenase subunit beta